MATSTGTKLQIPQIERIRADSTHIADALEHIAAYINANTTPAAGNAVAPANGQNPKAQLKVVPLNVLK